MNRKVVERNGELVIIDAESESGIELDREAVA